MPSTESPDKLTLATNTVGGQEPSLVRHRAAAARIIPRNPREVRDFREQLTYPIKVALGIILADGRVIQKGHFWYDTSGSRIAYQTIEAMFARLLVKIVVESRHRRKQIAELTEVGLRVARDLKREHDEDAPAAGKAKPLSETSARFIHAITDCGDQFEDATLVYGDGEP